MDTEPWFDNYSVLLADESVTRLDLFEQWIPGVTICRAENRGQIPDQVDSNTVVACLSTNLLGDEAEAVRKLVLDHNAFCQLVAIEPRSAFVSIAENEYDDCLQRPVFKRTLQETVERRWKYGTYGTTLNEFYYLNTERIAARQRSHDDAEQSARIQKLDQRYEAVKHRLAYLQDAIEGHEIRTILQSVKLHRKYLREQPTRKASPDFESKYQPGKCPRCGLPWGIDHQNELGKGFQPIGAYVWKCTRCDEIVHGLGSSHRRIAGH